MVSLGSRVLIFARIHRFLGFLGRGELFPATRVSTSQCSRTVVSGVSAPGRVVSFHAFVNI